jgi:PadR family transcriptional regulator PadR
VALEQISTDWTRAALPLIVLAALGRGENHGYALLKELQAMGLGTLKGGTLYPLLARHQEQGWVDFRWEQGPNGPARKIFLLTAAGHQELTRLSTDWQNLVRIVGKSLSPND